MDKKDVIKDLVESPISRRSFAKRIGMMSAGAVGTTVMGASIVNAFGGSAFAQGGVTDVDILNFALNLEYLEAEFYTKATEGATIEQEGLIPSSAVSGPTNGGQKVPNIANSPIAYIASQVTRDEKHHVQYLRAALGSAAVKKPTINLNALGFGFGNWAEFLKLATLFEDVGTSAYLGAAPLIQNKTYLDAAARIYGTEAQHSGALRTHAVDYGITIPAVDGKSVSPTPSAPFFVDSQGLTIPRSTREVLNIVYGNTGNSGGFYPNGLNGNIR